jgi:hypothetical protein
MENYTLTGLSKKEVETVGRDRYVRTHWKVPFTCILITIAIMLCSLIFDEYSIGQYVLLGVGGLGLLYTAFRFERAETKASQEFIKDLK